jgi:hypothetical protein
VVSDGGRRTNGTKLQEALDQINVLSGLLQICASCKRIRDEHQTWQPLESYIQAHSEAKFSHGVCPDCLRKLYPDYYSPMNKGGSHARGGTRLMEPNGSVFSAIRLMSSADLDDALDEILLGGDDAEIVTQRLPSLAPA